MDNKNDEAVSDLLQKVYNRTHQTDRIKLGDLVATADSGSFGLVILIFALLVLAPIPAVTSTVGFPLIFFSVQMIMGLDSLWMPKWLGNISLKRKTVAFIMERSARSLRKLEKFSRRRLLFMISSKSRQVLGMIIFLLSLSVMVPLPFTNLIPAIGIIIIAFGMLSKDGIIIFLGIFIGAIGFFLTFSIVFFGKGVVTRFLF